MKFHSKILGIDRKTQYLLNPDQREEIAGSLDFFKEEKLTTDTLHNRIYISSLLPSFPGKSWNRFFEGVKRIGLRERVPLWTDFVVTGKCHCSCWHCFRSDFKNNDDLDIAAFKKSIQEAYDLGTAIVGITGGEPMLRDDIEEFIQYVPDGMEIQLYTTGYGINQNFIRNIAGSNLTRFVVSLDHFDKTLINTRRGNAKAYDDVMNALNLLVEANIYTTVTLCITNDLLKSDDIFSYLDFVTKLAVDEIRIILPIPQGNLEGKNYKPLYIDAMKTLRKFKADTLNNPEYPSILLFCDYESQDCLGCGAGCHLISINNDGFVTPCVAVPLVFGNIYEQSLKDIYLSMGKYFKNSGLTCYGRKIGKVMKQMAADDDKKPYSIELSELLASQCVVQGRSGKFFEAAANFNREVSING